MSKSKQPPSPEELAVKLDSIHPDGSSDHPLEQEDVTGVLNLAMERLHTAQENSLAALKASTDRLLNETSATKDLAQRMSHPPPKEEK